VRQGCISLGKVQCDDCQRIIPYDGRYLIIDEEDGVEVESGQKSYYCVDCSLKKGYARYREERGEPVLTFFPSEPQSPQQGSDESSGKINNNE